MNSKTDPDGECIGGDSPAELRINLMRSKLKEYRLLALFLAKWICVTTPMAMIVGSACALFLWMLQQATVTRWNHPWLLYLLPLAGLVVAAIYHLVGQPAEGGSNLIMDQIHRPGGGVPKRMAPLILISTVITHICGGSAGREGTAVQMGGSIASAAARWLRLSPHDVRILLMCGIAAGFGGVFGTPLTGAVFAMEVLAVGKISYEGIVPCLIASIVSDWTCTHWGISHTDYHHLVPAIDHVQWPLLWRVAVAAIAFGLCSSLFAELTHGLQRLARKTLPWFLRPVVGALIVIALVQLLGTRDYLGLGITSPDLHGISITSCFQPGGATDWSWWWKLLFTAVTLGAGFKGGEVTPLFFIGAALGNTLGQHMGIPVDLAAAVGFVAIFAGATHTPLACTIMGIELFGASSAVYLATGCFLAYLASGTSGIYASQLRSVPKHGQVKEDAQPALLRH
jgi:H+/Cl- antiporter ClcA